MPPREADIKPDLIQREDEHYRRGVVLGLTMAEIVLLIIFTLMLLLMDQLRHKDEEIKTLAASQKIYAVLQEVAAAAGSNQLTPEQMPEYFQELILKVEKVQSLEAANASLAERNKELEELVARAVKATGQENPDQALKQLTDMAAAIDKAFTKNTNSNLSPKERSDMAAAAAQAAAELIAEEFKNKSATGSEKTVLQALAENRTRTEELERKNQDLQSQNQMLLAKNLEGGKGTEKPSCWYVKGTTRPEYIFDVSLGSEGVTVFDNNLPHRASEKAALPIGTIKFNSQLSTDEFLTITAALLQWSDEHDCRFFVRVYDETGPAEKMIYKRHLNTVEQRFYKFESFNPRPITVRN